MKSAQSRPPRRRQWYLLGTLIAVELLMSFSFLGYIHIEPISITVAYIPVLLAGALAGPAESAAVGAVFGLASMWKASASYVMAADRLFSPFMSGNPAGSLLLSVGSRFLFGLVIGLLYLPARRSRHPAVWLGVVSFFGQAIHSFMVYSTMALVFPEAGLTPLNVTRSLWGTSALANPLAVVVVLLLWHLMHTGRWLRFQAQMEKARVLRTGDHYHILSVVGMIVLTLFAAVAVTIYFVHRITYVFQEKGIVLPDAAYGDLVHLQIQFLLGILSMTALVILFLIVNRRYTTYIDDAARTDPLTGVLSRKAFFQAGVKALDACRSQEGLIGYFIMLDLDHFKDINDRHGHPEGDRVLQELGATLLEVFHQDCLIGRIGGDEFAVLLYAGISREELEVLLRRLLTRVGRIEIAGRAASCSVGALPVTARRPAEVLYREADALLYAAKERGRGQFVIGSPDGEG